MLKLERSKVEIEFGGESITMVKPSIAQFKKYKEELAKVSEEEQIEVMQNFFVSLGMPKEIVEELEVGHITVLVEALTDQKKS